MTVLETVHIRLNFLGRHGEVFVSSILAGILIVLLNRLVEQVIVTRINNQTDRNPPIPCAAKVLGDSTYMCIMCMQLEFKCEERAGE